MNTDLIDGITLDFDNLAGILGVCRVAAAAHIAGDADGYALRDADLPDALYAARELSASLKARVSRLYDSLNQPRGAPRGDTAGSASASGVAGLIDSVQARLATIDGLAARILEGCSGEDTDRAALADAIVTVAGKVTEELQAALELASPAPTRREGRE
jgi:hypothetical protein